MIRRSIRTTPFLLAGSPGITKIPFDRILVAQAARRNLTIVTNDRQILRAALTQTIKT